MTTLQSLCASVTGASLSELAPGYPLLTLHHGALTAQVSLYGGQLLSCRHGITDWLWANPTLQIKPGKALRAGVPICWPWFGNLDHSNPHHAAIAVGAAAALPAHGIVRTRMWQAESLKQDSESLTLVLGCGDDDSSRSLWPHRFHLQLQITLSDSLSVQLRMQNTDEHRYSVAGALHSYFAVSDISETSLQGLASTSYFDQLSQNTTTQQGMVNFAAETDRIYRIGAGSVQIQDSHQQLMLQQHGNHDTVVWTPWTDKAARLGDITGEDWRQFVCVETAIANEHAVELAPGAEYAMGFRLQQPFPLPQQNAGA